MSTFDIRTPDDRAPWLADQWRAVLIGEIVTLRSEGAALADSPIEVVTEPEPGATQIDGATFTPTALGVYSVRVRSVFGDTRRINFVAWEPEALDWLERIELANVTPGRERSRDELRAILRSLSNHERDKLTGRASDLHTRNLAHHGART